MDLFVKREDGLERVFWPYYILAAIAAVPCTIATGCRGWAFAAVYIASVIGWTVALVIAWVVLIWLLSLTVDLNKPVPEDHPFVRWIVITILGLLCRVGRVRIHVEGWENIPEGRFLLVGNHRSGYDPIITVWALRQRKIQIAFVTKPENLRIPLVRMIHKANYLSINREDARKALQTVKEAADLLTNDVVNVGIYPEGTRSKGEGMLPFHNAVFKIAQRADVPMVVAAIYNTENILKNTPWRHTDVTVRLCACLDREQVAAASTKVLGEQVRTILEEAGVQ